MRQRPTRGTDEQAELLDNLSKRFGKYALVVSVAKRAHDLRERIDSSLEPAGAGLVNRAIGEIARGYVKVRSEEPEQESD